MRESFNLSIERLLQHEGGYTNHPSDPGGPTNFGITIYDARKYLNGSLSARPPWTETDCAYMRALTVEQAGAIYKSRYWDALRCEELPEGLDYAMFDYGVNSGVSRAAKVLQRLLGVPADGIIGPVTLAAARACDCERVVAALCDERLGFLRALRTWPVFGKGWGRRVADVKDVAVAMADGDRVPDAARHGTNV